MAYAPSPIPTCRVCCGSVATFNNGKPKKYCKQCNGRGCRCGNAKMWGARQCLACTKQVRTAGKWHTTTCRGCGQDFGLPTGHLNRGTAYCSLSCRGAGRVDYTKRSHKRPACGVWFPICECGSQFTAQRAAQATCPACLSASASAVRDCNHCGTSYTQGQKWQRVCSDECRVEGRMESRRKARQSRKDRGLHDRGKHRERARRFGVAYERITLTKILQRDGPTCRLCGKKVNLFARVPDPHSATIDHIIPLSKGGPHLYTNVQVAHFRCNSSKGNRSRGEQLLLVG